MPKGRNENQDPRGSKVGPEHPVWRALLALAISDHRGGGGILENVWDGSSHCSSVVKNPTAAAGVAAKAQV